MMKLILSLTLACMLVSTAGALQCQACQTLDTTCSSPVSIQCSSQTQCVSAAIQASSPQGTLQQVFKVCAPPAVCPTNGSQTFSVSTSGLGASAAINCCNTDNCNTATPSPPPTQSVNDLKCYSCDYTNPNCSIQIQCKGVEDRCFRANVTVGSTTSPTLGCASANLCALATNLSSLPVVGGFSNLTCCNTKLCNSAPTTSTATISLLLGLLVFSLYEITERK